MEAASEMLNEHREKDEEVLRQAKLDITTGRKMVEKLEEIVVARRSHAETAQESYRKEEEAHAQLAQALNIERLKVRYGRNGGLSKRFYIAKGSGESLPIQTLQLNLYLRPCSPPPTICDNL